MHTTITIKIVGLRPGSRLAKFAASKPHLVRDLSVAELRKMLSPTVKRKPLRTQPTQAS